MNFLIFVNIYISDIYILTFELEENDDNLQNENNESDNWNFKLI